MTKTILIQAGLSILPPSRAGAMRFDADPGRQGTTLADVMSSRTV
jgi:hypothetical protein